MCIIGSKRIVFEGGFRGPPPELFLAVFIQNGVILCNNEKKFKLNCCERSERKVFGKILHFSPKF